MRSSPRAQGGPGGERILRVDNAVNRFGEVLPQRIAKEHLMPVQIPGHAGQPANSLEDERAEAEDGKGEKPTP